MVTSVSASSFFYVEIRSFLTWRQEERIRAMQQSLSFAIADDRDELLSAIREFLGGFTSDAKEQIIVKYFEPARSEIA